MVNKCPRLPMSERFHKTWDFECKTWGKVRQLVTFMCTHIYEYTYMHVLAYACLCIQKYKFGSLIVFLICKIRGRFAFSLAYYEYLKSVFMSLYIP